MLQSDARITLLVPYHRVPSRWYYQNQSYQHITMFHTLVCHPLYKSTPVPSPRLREPRSPPKERRAIVEAEQEEDAPCSRRRALLHLLDGRASWRSNDGRSLGLEQWECVLLVFARPPCASSLLQFSVHSTAAARSAHSRGVGTTSGRRPRASPAVPRRRGGRGRPPRRCARALRCRRRAPSRRGGCGCTRAHAAPECS